MNLPQRIPFHHIITTLKELNHLYASKKVLKKCIHNWKRTFAILKWNLITFAVGKSTPFRHADFFMTFFSLYGILNLKAHISTVKTSATSI